MYNKTLFTAPRAVILTTIMMVSGCGGSTVTATGGSSTTSTDGDGDRSNACAAGVSSTAAAPCDCNDGDPQVNPGALERCGNNADDNCNGVVDDGCGGGNSCPANSSVVNGSCTCNLGFHLSGGQCVADGSACNLTCDVGYDLDADDCVCIPEACSGNCGNNPPAGSRTFTIQVSATPGNGGSFNEISMAYNVISGCTRSELCVGIDLATQDAVRTNTNTATFQVTVPAGYDGFRFSIRFRKTGQNDRFSYELPNGASFGNVTVECDNEDIDPIVTVVQWVGGPSADAIITDQAACQNDVEELNNRLDCR